MSMMFAKQIQLVAGDPIEVGARRFLPSVLVVTHQDRRTPRRRVRILSMRPVAVIEEQGTETTWHALPDVTQERLSRLAGLALLIALIGSFVLVITWLLRRASS